MSNLFYNYVIVWWMKLDLKTGKYFHCLEITLIKETNEGSSGLLKLCQMPTDVSNTKSREKHTTTELIDLNV